MRSPGGLFGPSRFVAILPMLLIGACVDGNPEREAGPAVEVPAPELSDPLGEGSGARRAPGSEDLYAVGDDEGPDSVAVAEEAVVEGVGDEEDPTEAEGSEASSSAPVSRPYRLPAGLGAAGPPAPRSRIETEDFDNVRFLRPDNVRGLYVSAWAAGSSRRMDELIQIAATTEVNALVIDIKDATGFISHRTDVALAREIGADGEIRIRDLPGLLDRLDEAGVYPIARIVVVKDPLLAAARPQTAVQDTSGGVWMDSKEIIWQNLFDEELWDYNVALAREVAEMGFPEIQWDYIRFPDAPASDMARAVFPGGEGRSRVDAVRGFLRHAQDELSDLPVRSTADVFGVTTTFRRDVGIGQLWETFIDVVDVALPMVYPSHYWEGSFGYSTPNAYPYEIVYSALRDALRRSNGVEGAGSTRPWLQDFTLGSPAYGDAEVRAQIQATYDAGVSEWILWNPSTRYSIGALEPVGGFEADPLVRVAGVLTPTSRRFAVMDSVSAVEQGRDGEEPDTLMKGANQTVHESERTPAVVIPTNWTLPSPSGPAVVDSIGPAGRVRIDSPAGNH